MPRHFDIRVNAEDLEYKIREASGLASVISGELDNGTNPNELVDAWEQASKDLASVLARVKVLAR
jgi:hemoglobin-like flavoprotein